MISIKAQVASLLKYPISPTLRDDPMQFNIPIQNLAAQETIHAFDARGIAKRFRHAAIFGALDALKPGERMRFVNDHDPIPLLQQMQARYGNKIDIVYLNHDEQSVTIDFIVKAV